MQNASQSGKWQLLIKRYPKFFLFFFKFLFIYYSHTEREREAETQAEGARCGIRSRVSRIAPWAKGRRQTAAPPRDPRIIFFKKRFIYLRERERE